MNTYYQISTHYLGTPDVFRLSLDPNPTPFKNNIFKRVLDLIGKRCQLVEAHYSKKTNENYYFIRLANVQQIPNLLELNHYIIDFYILNIEATTGSGQYSATSYLFTPQISDERALRNYTEINITATTFSHQISVCQMILQQQPTTTFMLSTSYTYDNSLSIDESTLQLIGSFVPLQWWIFANKDIFIKLQDPKDIPRLYEFDGTLTISGPMSITPEKEINLEKIVYQTTPAPIQVKTNDERDIIQVMIYEKGTKKDSNIRNYPKSLFSFDFEHPLISSPHRFHLIIYSKDDQQEADRIVRSLNNDQNNENSRITAYYIDYAPYTVRVQLLSSQDKLQLEDIYSYFSSFGYIVKMSSIYSPKDGPFIMIEYSDLNGFKKALTKSLDSDYKVVPAMNSDPIYLGSPLYNRKKDIRYCTVKLHGTGSEIIHPLYGLLKQIPKEYYSITFSSSEFDLDSKTIERIFNSGIPHSIYFSSKNEKNQFIEFHFPKFFVEITAITIKTIPFPKNQEHLRSFDIDISVDGTNYQTLLQVRNCEVLNNPNQIVAFHSFDSPGFHFLRLKFIENWAGNDILALSKIDFFGSIVSERDEKARIRKAHLERTKEEKRKKKENQRKQRNLISQQLATRRYQLGSIQMSPLEESLFLAFRDCFELELRKSLPSLSENDITMTLFEIFQNLPPNMKLGIKHK